MNDEPSSAPPLRISTYEELSALQTAWSEYEWGVRHVVTCTPHGRLLFPLLEEEPGIYRMSATLGGVQHVYIGESSNLYARINRGYGGAHEAGATTMRIRMHLLQSLSEQGVTSIELLVRAHIYVRSNDHVARRWTPDLRNVLIRQSIERRLIGVEAKLGNSLLNLKVPRSSEGEEMAERSERLRSYILGEWWKRL